MTGTLIGIGWLYLLALPGGFPGAASNTIRERPAYITRVSIEVIRATSVTGIEVDAIRDQIIRIWRQEGVEVRFSSLQTELGEAHLRLVLADTAGRRPATRQLLRLRLDPLSQRNARAGNERVRQHYTRIRTGRPARPVSGRSDAGSRTNHGSCSGSRDGSLPARRHSTSAGGIRCVRDSMALTCWLRI